MGGGGGGDEKGVGLESKLILKKYKDRISSRAGFLSKTCSPCFPD